MTRKQKRELRRILISAALFVAGLLLPWQAVSLVLLLAAYLWIGWDVLKDALSGIIHGQLFDENFLMAIATIGALMIGEPHEAAAVMLFYQVGEWFQRYAVGKSRASITALMDICPQTAEVERNGSIETVDPEEVSVGELLVIRPGERVALDGVIVEGSSSLNTSALTGESLPRDVFPGDEVISGCVNQNGLLRVQVTKCYSDSTVARILELVENASDKKARMENFITRFARIYTPAVCAAALLLFLIPPLLLGGEWTVWGYRALSFLVVSCPCALVISVPLSFFGGIGCAGRHGILIKGSQYLEALSHVSTAVFDKTGTLTQGRFHVAEIHPNNVSEEELLFAAACAESASTHPISRSICESCKAAEGAVVQQVEEIPGQGVRAVYEGREICAGNTRLMESLGIQVPETEGTAVHVSNNGIYLGYLVIADEIKPGAKDALSALRKEGLSRLVMLTGDSESAARAVAADLGVDTVFARLLPADKVARVEELLNSKPLNTTLAFVGDGINDAPVLTRSDIGIAMGALGSDAAVEAADIVLMDDDPRKVALALRISRRTMSIAKQNIIFALAVKLGVLGLAAVGAAGMWLAVFADVGVAVLAILNAMRALKLKRAVN